MTERLLQFIWQFQYFNKNNLTTVAGEPIEIVAAGQLNTQQGPDFRQARIKIDGVLWAGDVELHIHASDWKRHRHHTDEQYRNVVLHVVYENDRLITDASGNIIPTLELSNRISVLLLQRYQHWMQLPQSIPCHTEMNSVSSITWQSWKQRLLVERLQEKAAAIQEMLQQTGGHWEQVCWQLLCKYFGGPVNAESFFQIAASLPVTILAKHKLQLHQLEALLLGQAGFLQKQFAEAYPLQLQNEYRFLQTKYQLNPVVQKPVFLRMRPVNFPTVRLAQLAMLVHQSTHLFSKIIECTAVKDIVKVLNVTAGAFWNHHYQLEELSLGKPKKAGKQLINSLLINVVVPMLFAYGKYIKEDNICERAVAMLESLPAEQNSVTDAFVYQQVENKDAFTSQALLHLKKHYCNHKRCLECAIGNAILKKY